MLRMGTSRENQVVGITFVIQRVDHSRARRIKRKRVLPLDQSIGGVRGMRGVTFRFRPRHCQPLTRLVAWRPHYGTRLSRSLHGITPFVLRIRCSVGRQQDKSMKCAQCASRAPGVSSVGIRISVNACKAAKSSGEKIRACNCAVAAVREARYLNRARVRARRSVLSTTLQKRAKLPEAPPLSR